MIYITKSLLTIFLYNLSYLKLSHNVIIVILFIDTYSNRIQNYRTFFNYR